jgi:hypothetical protein
LSTDTLLARLELVQRSGKGWRSACPACGGRSRKLSISEADDGRVLLHCFAGCEVAVVVEAAGLTIGDLFPERLATDTPEERSRRRRLARESQWGAALEMLELESAVVLLASRQLATWQPLSEEDDARLALACKRIDECRAILRDAPRWKPKKVAA